MAPTGTPPAIIDALRTAVAEIAKNPTFQQDAIRANGYETPQLAPQELPAFIASEIARDKALIDPIRSQLK